MISSFPKSQVFNLSGLKSFQFAPYQYIQALPAVVSNKITSAVSFLPGKSFLDGYSAIDMGLLTETGTKDENGNVIAWEITGFVPGDSDQLADLMETIAQYRHIVKVADHNNVMRLVGYNAPLDFTAIYNTGTVPGTDPKGYTFTFSGSGNKRAPVYSV